MSDGWNNDAGWGSDTGWDTGAAAGGTDWSGASSSTGGKRVFHRNMFIGALIGAVVGVFISLLLYDKMYDASGSNVLLVGLILGIMAGTILLGCVISEIARPCLRVDHEAGLPELLLALLAAVAVALVGCLCEFLYEINGSYVSPEFNDFIFVIDDSGSMSSTDPNMLRYEAMSQLIDSMEQDTRVGLVRFADSITDEVEMDYLTPAHRDKLRSSIDVAVSSGGTNIQLALEKALEQYQASQSSGRYPVVVLLSDGESYVNASAISRDYLDAGVAISPVGLSEYVNVRMLESLAQSTGGQFFEVSDASGLVTAFQQVQKAVSYRTLFTMRPGNQRGNVLLMILRVVFLMLPGLMIGFALFVILRENGVERQLVTSAATGLVSGLLMELGTYFFWDTDVVHILCWLLYGIVLLDYVSRSNNLRQSGLKKKDVEMGAGAFETVYQNAGGNSRLDKGQSDSGQDLLSRNDDGWRI